MSNKNLLIKYNELINCRQNWEKLNNSLDDELIIEENTLKL